MQPIRIARVSTSLLFVTAITFAQSAPTFEVASIKKAEPLNVNAAMAGKINLGMTIDDAQVHIQSMSLAELMRVAYKVKPYQVTGPEWLTAERYTITAKMPAGANRDQVPEMLQALLADRFKLTFHRETKEENVYALIVMKSGLKMQESAPDEPAPSAAPGGPAAPLAPTPTDGSAQVRVNVSSDAGGTVNTASPNGSMKMLPRENGMRIQVTHMNAIGMVDMLTRFVEKPVIDMTDLKGRYDFTLDVGLEDMLALARAAGMAIPIQAPPSADPGSSAVFTGIQQYGLKLDPRKAPIDLLVIDHVEKTPTEN
jgi:uncharacterized protein (TIGR03435 family)